MPTSEIPSPENLVIRSGCHVVIEMIDRSGNSETLAFDIVPDRAADFSRGLLGETTPLAQALIGRTAGVVTPYRVGDAAAIEILSVSPGSLPWEDAQERREQSIREAVEQSNRTSAMMFAASFTGKWGDYDPAALDQPQQNSPNPPPETP